MKQIKVFILFFIMHLHAQNNIDFIIFSYDRPLQLYALLESSTTLIKGLNDIFVIYRSSDVDFERGYALVQKEFPGVRYLRQGANPAQDFKELTLDVFQANQTKYVLFGVDDIVVKDEIDLDDAIDKMEQQNAYGFYLRLGRSLNYCYPMSMNQPLPSLRLIEGACMWNFNSAVGDWGYPHTVDMTIYRKKDIAHDLMRMQYINPNTFEGEWAGRSGPVMHRIGICYDVTKMVNLPLNRVNHSGNRHMNFLSAQELLDLFLSGKKMDIFPLQGIQNKSAHMEYEPTFVAR